MDEILEILNRLGGENPPSREELETARTELAQLMRDARNEPRPDLEALTSLRAAYDQAGEALIEAERAESEIAEQADALLDGVDVPEVETPTETETTVEATEPETEPVAAGVRVLPLSEAAARIQSRPRPQAEPVAEAPTGSVRTFLLGREHEGGLNVADLGNAFERSMRSPNVGKQTVARWDLDLPDGQRLPGETAANTALIDQITSPEAVAAAGGLCSLPVPIRSQTMQSSAVRPIQASLPTFGVTEAGAVTFFPAICLPQGNVAVWTSADDEAVDSADSDTWKDCDFVECPDAQTVVVDAIYRCVTIGNFQRRFAGEQWTAILQALLAQQARVADTRLFTQMLAAVNTTHTVTATGSTFVNLVQSLQLASDTIRQDQRYEGVMMRVWAASWLQGAIHSDLVARRLVDAENPAQTAMMLNTAMANAGINVTWSGDVDLIEEGSQPGSESAAALTQYPTESTIILAPEGHYTFLDGGQFDLGTEIRDHDLNRQNTVAAFAESFEGVMARGCNAKALEIPVEICEVAPGCGTES